MLDLYLTTYILVSSLYGGRTLGSRGDSLPRLGLTSLRVGWFLQPKKLKSAGSV